MADSRNYKLNQRDFISSLPDDILLRILSKLNINEQARTDVLSSRWTNLWTKLWIFNSRLHIDAEDFGQREADSQTKTLNFINTADRILRMHRGQVIDQLKIIYPNDPCDNVGDHVKVHNWIRIAKQKEVKALHLDFKLKLSSKRPVHKFSLGSTTFSSLINLRLENAFLSDNVIHDILSSSPNLLELSIIRSSWLLPHLKISGSSLKLEHLELVGNYILFIEISAPNLVSFNISTTEDALWPTICFKNIPLLTQLSCSLGFILHAWHDFYAVLPQLVTLTLTLSKKLWVGDIGNFPVLTNLKHMHVRWLSQHGGLLPFLLEMIRASPYLCRLLLDLGSYTPKHITPIGNFPNHKFLEEVEIHNFNGFKYEVQLLTCISKSCSSLKKITIHPSAYKEEVKHLGFFGLTNVRNVENVVKKLAVHKGLEIVYKVPVTSNF